MTLPRGLVWITGASSGIGWATALHLARNGYDIAVSARNEDALQRLAAKDDHIRPYPLDVADPITREEVYQQIRADLGPVDVLINNAGYGMRSTVEDIQAHELRDIYDINVFAPVALSKLVLPEMRERRMGRIINVSSVVGRVSLPLSGIYASTKFALEALTDAMRVELRPWDIQCVLIEPGPIKTRFSQTAKNRSVAKLNNSNSAYAEAYERFLNEPPFKKESYWGAATVAEAIRKAVMVDSPKARYPVHPVAHILPLLNAHLPTAWRDRIAAERFGFLREDER